MALATTARSRSLQRRRARPRHMLSARATTCRLPLDLYLVGAGAAVALSFVIMALVFRASAQTDDDQPPLGSICSEFGPTHASCFTRCADRRIFRAISARPFPVGSGSRTLRPLKTRLKNFGPTFVWIIWWVGLAYVAALVGNHLARHQPLVGRLLAGFEKLDRLVRTPRIATRFRVGLPIVVRGLAGGRAIRPLRVDRADLRIRRRRPGSPWQRHSS